MTAVAMTVLPDPVMADSANDERSPSSRQSRRRAPEALEDLERGVALVVAQLVAHQARPRSGRNIDRYVS